MDFLDFLLNTAATISGAIGLVIFVREGFLWLESKRDKKSGEEEFNALMSLLAVCLMLFMVCRYFMNYQRKMDKSLETSTSTTSASSALPVMEPSSEDISVGVGSEVSVPVSSIDDTTDDTTQVPDVVGMNVYEAEQLLTIAGFQVDGHEITENLYVCSQSPEANQSAVRGENVKLEVSTEQVVSPKQTLHDYFLQEIEKDDTSEKKADAGDGNEIAFWSLGCVGVQEYNFNSVENPINKSLNYLPEGLCFVDVTFQGIITSDTQLVIYYKHADGSVSPMGLNLLTENNATLIVLPRGSYVFQADADGHSWKGNMTVEQSGIIAVQMEQVS